MSPQTILLRQVHPDFVQEGLLTSQAFMPFPKDDGKPSVYDGDQISAVESHTHYTQVLGNKAEGVWGVTCTEVSDCGLNSSSAPLVDFPSHALIDFTSHPENQFRKLAKKLKAVAAIRGRLHP